MRNACVPQKYCWYLPNAEICTYCWPVLLIRRPSRGPVLDLQAGDLTKVCEISREQGRITGPDNRGNLQVHGSDPQTSTPELLEGNRRGFVKRQNWNPSVVVQMLQPPPIGFNLMRHGPRTCQIRHPASHLFFITDDRGDHLWRRQVCKTSAQRSGARLVAPLQHAQMIGIQHDHGAVLPLASRRRLRPKRLAVLLPKPHGAFVERVVLKRPSDLFPPRCDEVPLFQLAFQLGNFRFQGGDTFFKSCRCHATLQVPHHSSAQCCWEGVVPKTVPIASYHLLFKPIVMVQPAKNRTRHDSLVIWNAMPVRL